MISAGEDSTRARHRDPRQRCKGTATPWLAQASASPIRRGYLNGDGHPDLAVAGCGERCNVTVLINHGNGTFAAGEIAADVATKSMAVVDLNSDSYPDIAFANGGSAGNSVSVMLNRHDGTFDTPTHHELNRFAIVESVATADLNGDGHPDIAVAAGSVSVLFNQGDGTFAAAVSLEENDVVASGIAAADLDGDGYPDLAVAGRGSSTASDVGAGAGAVKVLLNQGDGTFVGSARHAFDYRLSTIAAADLYGDGHPDLQGDGAFAAAADYNADAIGGIAAADFNGDGRPDLAVLGYRGGVGVLFNTCLP
ncbi:FG-GAP repeat domain-containing protein [Sorangium cellulosum]|uniref:FG-GAP repeat domain-containing protein n=1 Tax=Sorangium cellulosum TaxID=56 RepID=UPI003D9A7427